MKLSLRFSVLLTVGIVALMSTAGAASAQRHLVRAAASWAPVGSATIHPGVMTFSGASSFLSGASQCTSNFVFTDGSGAVYLGQAAHCTSTGSSTGTNGCDPADKSLPLGTPVYSGDLINGGVQNGTLIGTLAYNSW